MRLRRDGDQPLLVVLRALKLGDFFTGLPALRAIADAYPDHYRVLAAPGWLAPLVAHVGVVDALAPTGELEPIDDSLDAPDVAIDLHGRGPRSQPLLLALSPRRLIAFAHPDIAETRGSPEWRAGEHEVERWCRLLRESGVDADPHRLDINAPDVPLPADVDGATLIHPGASTEARRWPPDRFAAVARAEHKAGRRVFITGSTAEASLAHAVARAAGLPTGAVLAGRTDTPTLVATVAAAGRLVCGDTGVAHVATAVRTPSVVLFGPVSPAEWGPPPDRPWHRALWAGRHGDPHASVVDGGLLSIGVDAVLDALSGLPERVPRLRAAARRTG